MYIYIIADHILKIQVNFFKLVKLCTSAPQRKSRNCQLDVGCIFAHCGLYFGEILDILISSYFMPPKLFNPKSNLFDIGVINTRLEDIKIQRPTFLQMTTARMIQA